MPRYKLEIEYCGTGTHGWQIQPDDITLQKILESALYKLTNQKTEAVATGRTDAGVHALSMTVHFDLEGGFDIHKLVTGLNHYLLDEPISVLNAQEVDGDFHARFSAKKRFYRYIILNRLAPPSLDLSRVWHVKQNLDVSKMAKAAKHLLGNHDFSSFRAALCQAKSPVKTMDKINISKQDDKIIIELEALSFLHHQCRNIVGTLKEVGEGKINPDEIPDIIDAKDRSAAGITAPAHGLYFVKVEY